MLGNNMVTALSLIGVLVITLGTVLGIIGVATSEWIIFQDNEISHNTTFYNNTFRDTEFHDLAQGPYESALSCHLGLWQICCAEYGDMVHCEVVFREVTSSTQVVRALMVCTLVVLILSVILIIVYLFKERCHPQTGAKQCISFLAAIGALGYLMLVVSYVLIEYSDESGFFAEGRFPGLSWSFGLAVVGALLNPIGLWMVCTQWHLTSDKDAGVKYDYEKKPRTESNAFVDTYI